MDWRSNACADESPREASRVLIVDDDRDSADTLRELLEMEGHDPVVAYDGPHAIALAASFHPEIVLLDLDLRSTMNGHEVCHELSTARGTRPRIIAITGQAKPDEGQLQRAGFDAHIAKPINVRIVLDLVSGVAA
jgi:CheY-like chemotaxis protein